MANKLSLVSLLVSLLFVLCSGQDENVFQATIENDYEENETSTSLNFSAIDGISIQLNESTEPSNTESEVQQQMNVEELFCDETVYPVEDFIAQPDNATVYMKVARFPDDSIFQKAGLSQFTSVFGIRLVADASVSENQLLHLTRILAHVLDADNNGKADNIELIESLHEGSATLFVMKDIAAIQGLMVEDGLKSFPFQLQYCPLFFDFEETTRILPQGKSCDATCLEGVENSCDRSIAFILDHLIGRGYEKLFSKEEHKKILESLHNSVKSGIFDPRNTGCPIENEDCITVMYVSWAMSSYRNFDSCWCEKAQALFFCDKDSLALAEPELIEIISEKFKHIDSIADKIYPEFSTEPSQL